MTSFFDQVYRYQHLQTKRRPFGPFLPIKVFQTNLRCHGYSKTYVESYGCYFDMRYIGKVILGPQ